MNRLLPIEQETIIIFNEQELLAEITTYNEDLKLQFKELEGEEIKFKRSLDDGAVTYTFPKNMITIREKKKRNVTQEERRRRSERMKNIRAKK